MRRKFNAGYSTATANIYINQDVPVISLSSTVEPVNKWVNDKPTDEVDHYSAWFCQEGAEPFKVKFENELSLPKFDSKVKLDDLEACEIGNNVYFRANGIKEIR